MPYAYDSLVTSSSVRCPGFLWRNRLNEVEAVIVLRRLLIAHPELDLEADEIAQAMLRDDNFEDIAEDVYDSIHVLGIDKLNGRAGRREWGYVEPGDAASEILSETVTPLLTI